MAHLILRPDWDIPERLVTPEAVYRNRRHFLKQLGIAGAGLLSAPMIGSAEDKKETAPSDSTSKLYPAKRNPDYNPDWKLSDEKKVASYNNFYEFSLSKEKVQDLVGDFVISPWEIEVTGLVEKPFKITLEDVLKLAPLEERVYRFRCVEAWAMIVPWTGFPLSKLIEKCKPKAEAKFVRFETPKRPEQMPGMRQGPTVRYPWPYFEGLRMDEALHPLTMVVTGMYGKPLPKQNGAPIRLIVPWKYGYKSAKSVSKIEFVDKQPTTFWETLAPTEYPFESNVDPTVPHPRWSQARERMIDSGDSVKTLPLNGYGDQVAKLYGKV